MGKWIKFFVDVSVILYLIFVQVEKHILSQPLPTGEKRTFSQPQNNGSAAPTTTPGRRLSSAT